MLKRKTEIISIIIFFILAFILNYFVQKRNHELISRNTLETYAFYDSYTVVKNTGPISYFNFQVKGQKILFYELGKYDFLKKGDTVLIKYSAEDPNIAEVIDFCYMQKYKGKCDEQ